MIDNQQFITALNFRGTSQEVYKELERVLKSTDINLSIDKVLNIARTITTLKVKMPHSGNTYTKTMLVSTRHKLIAKLFDDDFWVSH